MRRLLGVLLLCFVITGVIAYGHARLEPERLPDGWHEYSTDDFTIRFSDEWLEWAMEERECRQ